MNTDEELTAVMTEFYQRGQAEPKTATGVPEPIKVESSLQVLHATEFPHREIEPPKGVVDGGAKVGIETEFDFAQYSCIGNVNNHTVTLSWYMRCHNKGRIAQPVWMQLLQATWGALAPGLGGPYYWLVGFNAAQWTPPAQSEGWTLAQVITQVRAPDLPAPHPPPPTMAHGFLSIKFLRVKDNQPAGKLYAYGDTSKWDWTFYSAGFTIDFDFTIG